MTTGTATTNLKWHERARQAAENLGVSFAVSLVVSGVVAGIIGNHFESRLENSKERVAILVDTKQKFDETHNELLARVAVYANEVWARQRPIEKDKILETIIKAQAQLLELKRQIGNDDDPLIVVYGDDLVKLQEELDVVSKPEDLRPVYASVLKLLDEHDKIAAEITTLAKVKPSV
ncbi:MAG TPA: hypothetical protein VG387_05270 [Rhizomicrobium sp.]|nr:hypothetical protein [Rhizomicrobium sp.]